MARRSQQGRLSRTNSTNHTVRLRSILNALWFVGPIATIFSALNAAAKLPYLAWPALGQTQLLGLLMLVAASASLFLRPSSKPSGSLLIPIGVGVALTGFTLSLVFSDFPTVGGVSTLVPVIAGAFGVLSWRLIKCSTQPEAVMRSMGRSFIFVGLAVSLVGLGKWLADYAVSRDAIGMIAALPHMDPATPLPWDRGNGHPLALTNPTAGFAAPLAILALAIAMIEQRAWRWLATTAGGLGALLVLSTGSRSGTVGLLLGLSIGAGLYFLEVDKGPRKRTLMLLSGGGILILGLTKLLSPRVFGSFSKIASGEWHRPFSGRIEYVQSGLSMIGEHPLLGVGPGAVPFHYPLHWNGGGNFLPPFQLHSTPVQMGAESGVLTVMGVLLLLTGLALGLRRLLGRSRSDPQRRILAVGLSLALLASLPMTLTDYQLNIIPVAMVLAFVIGSLAALVSAVGPAPASTRRSRWRQVARFGIIVLAVAYALLQIRVARARGTEHRALLLLENGHLESFRNSMNGAIKVAPDDLSLHNRLGYELADEALKETRSRQRRQLLEGSISAFSDSLQVWETQEFAHSFRGLSRLMLGQAGPAARDFQRAAELNPMARGNYHALGVAWGELGADEPMHQALALECLVDPTFVTVPTWRSAWSGARKPVLHELEKRFAEIGSEVPEHPALATVRYLWFGEVDANALEKHPVLGPWLADVASNREVVRPPSPSALGTPLPLLHGAWRNPDEADAWISALLERESPGRIDDDRRRRLAASLSKEADGFLEWLRKAAHRSPKTVARKHYRTVDTYLYSNRNGNVPGFFLAIPQSSVAQTGLQPLIEGVAPKPTGTQLRAWLDQIDHFAAQSPEEKPEDLSDPHRPSRR